MISTLPNVGRTVDVVRAGLHGWIGEVLRAGGVTLPVVGTVADARGPALVLLPYQLVLESHATSPTVPLVPVTEDFTKDTLPAPWRRAGHLVTRMLVETFPAREAKGPGIGPVSPSPRLADLPAPIAAWYRAHAADGWVVEAAEPRARLPMVEWRQPFALAIRVAALVTGGAKPPEGLDGLQLRALALVGAGVRLARHFVVQEPPYVGEGPLLALLRAFARVDHPAAAELAELVDLITAPRDLAVGLTAHHELSDQDLALMMRTLQQPMQPAIVFSARVALGAGPELAFGALPHLGSVEGNRR